MSEKKDNLRKKYKGTLRGEREKADWEREYVCRRKKNRERIYRKREG